MSILKRIVVALLVIIALFVVIGFLLPSSARVERAAIVEAPPSTVFALVNGFRRWNDWSPWYERDPQAEYTREGPDFGVGARMIWSSDRPDVGSGSIEIVESTPHSVVRSQLDFGEQGTAETFFRIEPAPEGTRVTWGFDTEFGTNLVSRYFGLMFEKWVGADYEAGLLNLKKLAEELPPADWADLEIEVVEVEPMLIAYTTGSSSWDHEAIGQALAGAYGQVMAFVSRRGLEQVGPPLAVTLASDESGWEFDAGIPVAGAPEKKVAADSPVQIRDTYAGRSVRATHLGPYAGLMASWEKVYAFAAAHGLEAAGNSWEEFVSDPGNTPEEELITELFLPVR